MTIIALILYEGDSAVYGTSQSWFIWNRLPYVVVISTENVHGLTSIAQRPGASEEKYVL